jgi:glutamyl-tRNA synthetase
MADGRFAPSPTGDLHLGNLRTALVAWLCARSAGSRFGIRMEDLDQGATRPEHAERQLADLHALGLDWDGPVVFQSTRLDRYRDAIAGLVGAGLTYPCYCSRREIREAVTAPNGPGPDGAYPGTCRHLTAVQRREREASGRPPALRVHGDGVVRSFVDRFAGPHEGPADDVVIRRNDGTPSYNLVVVVDDVDQGFAEVVRADDLLASTPRQLHLADLLDLAPPSYGHVPLVLGPDGTRLAKRDGAVTLADRAALGIGPDAVRAELAASLGLSEPGEPVTPGTLVERFVGATLPREPWVLDASVLDPPVGGRPHRAIRPSSP